MRLLFASCSALAIAIGAAALQGQSGGQTGGYTPGAGGSAGVVAAAEKATGSSTLTAVPEDFSKLKIAPGFLLDSEVFDESDLSGQFRVGEDGNITLPFVGNLHVAGDTPAQAQKKIQDALKAGDVLKNPQVTLNIVQYAPTMVTVLGEVNSPGRLQMLVPHNLLDVLSFVGGETSLAGTEVQVRHDEAGQVTTTSYRYGRNGNTDAISAISVHDGDTVIVPRAGIVYVLGAVTRPGGYVMQEDGKLNAIQAISLAMGTTLQARTGIIRIIRRKPDGTYEEFRSSYRAITDGKVTPPELQAQDIVYVPVNKIKAVLADSTAVLSSATSATIYSIR